MSRLKKNASDIEKYYNEMCESVAYDIKNNSDGDVYELAEGTAKNAIESIKKESFLSDFEKTVRDYFNEKKLTLCYETLESDIIKYF